MQNPVPLLVLLFIIANYAPISAQLSVYTYKDFKWKQNPVPVLKIPVHEIEQDHIPIDWEELKEFYVVESEDECGAGVKPPPAVLRQGPKGAVALLTTGKSCSLDDIVYTARELGYKAVIVGPRKDYNARFRPSEEQSPPHINVIKVDRQIWGNLRKYRFLSFIEEDERYVFKWGPVKKSQSWEEERRGERNQERKTRKKGYKPKSTDDRNVVIIEVLVGMFTFLATLIFTIWVCRYDGSRAEQEDIREEVFQHFQPQEEPDLNSGWKPGRNKVKTALKILGLKKGYTRSDLINAIRAKSMEFHPDKWRQRDVSEEEGVIMNEKLKFINAMKQKLEIGSWLDFLIQSS